MPEGEEPNLEQESGSGSALSAEEIEFLRDKVTRVEKTARGHDFSVANKAISEANWLFDHPELGMQEERSSQFLARRLSSILGKENVGEVGGGVYGILEGNQENGATIFIRADMDALITPEGKPAHMCGHNIHMAWLLENARLLSAYKEHFAATPFKRIVFIGEPNEEGVASPAFGPQEMLKAGLIEKTGRPDFILGAHFAAPQIEGQVRIDEGTATYSDGRFYYSFIPQDENQDVRMLEYEFIYQVGKNWGSEDSQADLGRLLIVDDCRSRIPETLVRVTDSKIATDERRLQPNVLTPSEEVELHFSGVPPVEEIKKEIESIKSNWEGVEIEPTFDNQSLRIKIGSRGGHVSQGGPNVKFIMAELIHNLKDKYDFSIKDGNKLVELTGSLRTGAKDWQNKGMEIGMRLQEIAHGVVSEAHARVEVKGDTPKIDNPPTYNDDNLRQAALSVLQRAGLSITNAGIPMAPAETFAFWETELNIPGLYITIGGGDKGELERIKTQKLAVPSKYLHHTPGVLDLVRANRAIPYGAAISLIALELGKKFSK